MKHRQVITIVILLPCLSIFAPSAAAQTSINKPTVDHCLADIGGQVYVDDAEFIMGNDATYPEEGPAHPVSVSAFWLDSHEVTNAQFSQFVVKTGYVTTRISRGRLYSVYTPNSRRTRCQLVGVGARDQLASPKWTRQ